MNTRKVQIRKTRDGWTVTHTCTTFTDALACARPPHAPTTRGVGRPCRHDAILGRLAAAGWRVYAVTPRAEVWTCGEETVIVPTHDGPTYNAECGHAEAVLDACGVA